MTILPVTKAVSYTHLIAWVKATFPVERKKEMKGQPWGVLYNKYKDVALDPDELENRISALIQDPDVTNQRGVYLYVLNGKEKHLNIRQFDERKMCIRDSMLYCFR